MPGAPKTFHAFPNPKIFPSIAASTLSRAFPNPQPFPSITIRKILSAALNLTSVSAILNPQTFSADKPWLHNTPGMPSTCLADKGPNADTCKRRRNMYNIHCNQSDTVLVHIHRHASLSENLQCGFASDASDCTTLLDIFINSPIKFY